MKATGWRTWSRKVPMFMDSCRECNSGKCKVCNGSGYVTHECSAFVLGGAFEEDWDDDGYLSVTIKLGDPG